MKVIVVLLFASLALIAFACTNSANINVDNMTDSQIWATVDNNGKYISANSDRDFKITWTGFGSHVASLYATDGYSSVSSSIELWDGDSWVWHIYYYSLSLDASNSKRQLKDKTESQ